jgi:hypothetical protein
MTVNLLLCTGDYLQVPYDAADVTEAKVLACRSTKPSAAETGDRDRLGTMPGAVSAHHGLVLSSRVVDWHGNHHDGALGMAQAVGTGRAHEQVVGHAMAVT